MSTCNDAVSLPLPVICFIFEFSKNLCTDLFACAVSPMIINRLLIQVERPKLLSMQLSMLVD